MSILNPSPSIYYPAIFMPEYEIKKPILVCDACNDLLIDKAGKVYKNCNWNEWGLSCDEHDMSGFEVFER